MSTLKVNEVRHLSNSGTANIVLESNATTNLQTTSTLGLTVNGTLTVSGVGTFNGNVQVGNSSTDTMVLTSTVSGFNNFSGFTGEIRMYAGNAAGDSPPAGWLYCNGDTISSTTGNGGTHYNLDGKGNDYQPLFNLLKASSDWGNSSSASWGTNTVKLPDFRSRAPVGIHTGAATSIGNGTDSQALTARTLGDTVGAEKHTLIEAELASHTHVMTNPSANANITATHSHTHGVPGVTTNSQSTTTSGGESQNHVHAFEDHLYGRTGVTNARPAVGGDDNDYGTPNTGANHRGHTHSYSHTHTTPATTTNSISSATVAITDGAHAHSVSAATTGSGTPHPIIQPIIAVNYIIKV